MKNLFTASIFFLFSLPLYAQCENKLSNEIVVSASHGGYQVSDETRDIGFVKYSKPIIFPTEYALKSTEGKILNYIEVDKKQLTIKNCEKKIIAFIEEEKIEKFLYISYSYKILDASKNQLAEATEIINPGLGQPRYVFKNTNNDIVALLRNGITKTIFGESSNSFEMDITTIGLEGSLTLPVAILTMQRAFLMGN